MRFPSAMCVLAAFALAASGCGTSHKASAPGRPQTVAERLALQEAKHHGDAHAVITRIENVRVSDTHPGNSRWTMILMKSRHGFRLVGCPSSRPGPQGECGAHYLEVGINASNHQPGLMWGLTASQVSAITRARNANPLLRIFPDTPALYTRCAIPRGGLQLPNSRPLVGTCTTVADPTNDVRRVEFHEDFQLPNSKPRDAGWVVTLDSRGHVQSIRAIGEPPQVWK